MASKSCATPYYFAASAEDKLSSSLQARWDPNAPGCFGVSQDDGTFRYCTPDGSSACFQLFASAQLLAPAADEASLRPAPVNTAWSHWAFVPGQAGHLLFAHCNSDQLYQTCVPAGAVLDTSASSVPASHVWVCREATFATSLTALAVSDDGARAGVGKRDGSLSFWRLAPPGPSKPPMDAALFTGAHRGPIGALAILCDSLPQHQLQLAIAVSASVDQTLRVWDLHAAAPLHRIVVGEPSPLCFVGLHLLSPGAAAAAAAHRVEPSVLVLAGNAGGRCEAWSLASSSQPQQAACWQAASAGPVLHLELDALSASVVAVAVAEGGGGPEVEVRSCPSSGLLAQKISPHPPSSRPYLPTSPPCLPQPGALVPELGPARSARASRRRRTRGLRAARLRAASGERPARASRRAAPA